MSPTAKAIFTIAKGQAAIREVPIPELREGHVLVRARAVALNPADWKSVDHPTVGAKAGCDYAGVVEAVGPGAAAGPFAPGDRVCGMTLGNVDAYRGAFGEYVLAPAHLMIRVPDGLGLEEAATLGAGVTTVGQGLYQLLGLPLPAGPLPPPPARHILIYGGSTATGILGIQFARLSGLTVLATASPGNFDYLRSLGAAAVFDYHAPVEDLAREIRAQTGNRLTCAWDCSPSAESARLCALSMSDSEEGAYGSLLPVQEEVIRAANPMVTRFGTNTAYTAIGEAFSYGGVMTWEASPEDALFASKLWELSGGLLAQGKVKAARMDVNRGGEGLEGVIKGIDELRQGKVSGRKLVYTI